MGYIITGTILILIILYSLIERKLLMTVDYQIKSDKLSKEFDGLTFVLLADLHNNTFGDKNQRLLNAIHKAAPEFIIIAGDMVNKEKICLPSHAYTLLEQLAKEYTIYYGYGNHEKRLENNELKINFQEYKNKLNKAGIIFLNNESRIIKKGNSTIRITGFTLEEEYYKPYKIVPLNQEDLNKAIIKGKDSDYQILIAHNPMYFNEYRNWGSNLTLSGHMHGGMIRLPHFGGMLSPQVSFFPKYDAGLFKEDEQDMVISRGLGTHSFMPRIMNRPEVVRIILKSGQTSKT